MSARAAPDARRDRLKQLRAFCEAVRLGSLSAAARAVESSQPAVSNHVRTLEEDLGAVLFRRQGGGIVPTRVGSDLYRTALPLVEGLLRLPALFDEYHHGAEAERLRIGAGQVSAAYVLPDIIKRYVALYPRTRVELVAGTGGQRLEWLRRFEIDIIFGAFEVVPDDLVFHRIVTADVAIITPEGHPLGRRKRAGLDALTPHPMVALVPGHYMRQFQDMVLQLHAVRPRIVLEVDGWETMVHHIAAGVGVGLVPDLCAAEDQRICRVPVPHPFSARAYGLAVRRDGLMGLAARRLFDLVVSAAVDAEKTP